MKIELTKDVILNRLCIEKRPVGILGGEIVFEENVGRTPYIVFDTKLTGFGVKVSASKKTYLMQKKVAGRVMKSKIGEVAEFVKVQDARDKAAGLSVMMRETGSNPNTERRRLQLAEATLGQAMEKYKDHLKSRSTPAQESTISNFERSERKLSCWTDRRIKSLGADEIKGKFDELAKKARTSTEQAFRWATTSVEHVLAMEAITAQSEGRTSSLFANPFRTLVHLKVYRTRAELAKDREERGVRNPLTRERLGRFLETLWSKREVNDNRTGCDYILLMLILGCRKSEHAGLVWRELLAPAGEKPASDAVNPRMNSWVDLEKGEVFFHWTKNGLAHRLPLPECALELLRRRKTEAAAESARRGFGKSRRFVFPAKSRFSKTGHYNDSQDLLKRLRVEADIPTLTRHDLRRTFGTTAVHAAGLSKEMVGELLNHGRTDVTDRYTEAEWSQLKAAMQRIENSLLTTAPNLYNSLKPIDWPPLQAPEPHKLAPVKPRTGRPRKDKGAADVVASAG